MIKHVNYNLRRWANILTCAALSLSPRTYFSRLRVRTIEPGTKMKPSGRFVILVVFQKYGLGDEMMQLLAAFNAAGYNVILISNAALALEQRAILASHCFTIIQRRNIGHDFGAYKDGIDHLLGLGMGIDRLVLMNDSVVPTSEGLRGFIDKLTVVRDFGGATESFRPVYHIQSYCLCFSQRVVSHPAFMKFWRKYRPISNRSYAIRRGELKLSRRLLNAGLKAEAIYTHEAMAAQLMELDADHLYFLNIFLGDQFIRQELDRYRKIFLDLSESAPDLPVPIAVAQHDRRVLRRSYMRLALAKRLAVKRRAVDFLIEYMSRRSTVHHAGFLLMMLFQFPFLKRNISRDGIFTLPRVQEALRVLDIQDRQHMIDCLKAAGK